MAGDARARLEKVGARPADILLPAPDVDLTRFAVVACDQFSAQPSYWEKVRAFVGDAPSALHMMMPEAWLESDEAHARAVPGKMEEYLEKGVLRSVGEGMIFIHRGTTAGVRRGLVLALDLENYDYTPGSRSMIRATEKTVVDRLPPRIAIRGKAPLEMPHIMILVNDRENTLMGALDGLTKGRRPIYDFPLMMDSGHLTGWFLSEEEDLSAVAGLLETLAARAGDGMLYAMGDGNHSFAAAKAHWDALKETLPEEARRDHPARFALCELVNLYDPALTFEPMHRLLMHVDPDQARRELGIDPMDPPSLQDLQPLLDEWLQKHPGAVLEYIHGRKDCLELGKAKDNLAIVWDRFDRESLFPDVEKHGVLCRKSFSMGTAGDKRFYLECRRIRCQGPLPKGVQRPRPALRAGSGGVF